VKGKFLYRAGLYMYVCLSRTKARH